MNKVFLTKQFMQYFKKFIINNTRILYFIIIDAYNINKIAM